MKTFKKLVSSLQVGTCSTTNPVQYERICRVNRASSFADSANEKPAQPKPRQSLFLHAVPPERWTISRRAPVCASRSSCERVPTCWRGTAIALPESPRAWEPPARSAPASPPASCLPLPPPLLPPPPPRPRDASGGCRARRTAVSRGRPLRPLGVSAGGVIGARALQTR